MKSNTIKILAIISLIILIGGLMIGNGISKDIGGSRSSKENIYVDGTDVSGISDLFVEFFAGFLGIIIIVGSATIVGSIWIIYGIILLIKAITKQNSEKDQE